MNRYSKKFGFLLICLVFIFHYVALGFCATEDDALLMEGASLKEKDGLFVLHVKGSPYQMGFQHGKLLKAQIKVVYNDYLLGSLRAKTKTQRRLEAGLVLFKRKARAMDKFIPEEYKQEMRGIAEGSGFSYDDILIMHTFLDVVSNPKIFKHGTKSCTNFVAMNSASSDARLIHGRNLSWPSRGILEKNTVVIFYQPKNGNPFVAFSWPGICGVLTGMNDNGITLGETSVGTQESTLYGIPAFFLFRYALQYSDTLYNALGIIGSNYRTTGYTVTLSDAKCRKAAVVEFTSDHYQVRFPRDDYLISTNHFQDTDLLETMRSVYPDRKLEESSSYKRLVRMDELIRENHGKIDGQKAKEFLGDKTMCTQGTFLSAVFQPEDLKFSLAVGRSSIQRGEFVDFDFAKEMGLLPLVKDLSRYPEEFYAYPKGEIQYKKTLIEETVHYKKFLVVFSSLIKTDFMDNTVYLKYYEPKNTEHFPVVLVLPHSAGSSDTIEGQFCQNLAEEGIGSVIVNMSYQEKGKSGHQWLKEELKREDLQKIYQLFKQLVIEARRTIDWLEEQPKVDKQNFGIMGISLGAITAPIVVSMDARIKSALYILGGGDIAKIVYYGNELPFLKERLIKQKLTPLQFERKYSIMDPLNYGFQAKNIPTLMYNSIFDEVIPMESTIKLWRVLNEPKIYWVPATHYTAALFIGNVKSSMAEHFGNTLKYKLAKKEEGFKLQATEHLQVSRENFLNKKIKITGSAKYDESEKRIRLGLMKEDIFSTPFFAGVDVSGKWEEDERYHLKGQGEDVYAGMMVTKKTKLTVKLENQEVKMYGLSNNAPQIMKDNVGTNQTRDIAFILEKSSLDKRYYPTKGTYHSLEWDYAAKTLGSDYNFNRLTWQSRGYLTPGEFFTFMARTKVGWMEEFGSTNEIPYFERFFAGGASTIRGYKSRQAGPKDSSNLPLGGNFLWVNNFEVRFPIWKELTGAYFFDMGSLWSRPDKLSFEDLKCSTGIGLRYITPWGVARLDYGVRLTHDKDEPRSRIHLSFGIPF